MRVTVAALRRIPGGVAIGVAVGASAWLSRPSAHQCLERTLSATLTVATYESTYRKEPIMKATSDMWAYLSLLALEASSQ